jgi:uncharacterized membrane protein
MRRDQSEPLPSHAQENLELLERLDHYAESEVSGLRRVIERISDFCGSPTFLISAVAFMVGWAVLNAWGSHAGWRHVDAPPFAWLQGIVSSIALLLTVAVLIRQNRMAQLAEHRAHLDLQINLMAEQKVAKILELVAELHGEKVDELTKPADPHALLDAIKQKKGPS